MPQARLIDKLNYLAERCTDGKEGYALAAHSIAHGALRLWLFAKAEQRGAFATALHAEAVRLGGGVERTGSFIGQLHREWLSFRKDIVDQTTEDILEECIRGEEHAAADYRRVLHAMDRNTEASAELTALVRAQYDAIETARRELTAKEETLA